MYVSLKAALCWLIRFGSQNLLRMYILIFLGLLWSLTLKAQSWTADNGNGTYTNPLFYDEFSDPDIVRVGNDFYLTGTTMHSVPGLPVLHSKDLVNWKLISYAMDRFNLGEEFYLTNGKEAYGQGIWAPCIRHHNGVFYIFSNANRQKPQVTYFLTLLIQSLLSVRNQPTG